MRELRHLIAGILKHELHERLVLIDSANEDRGGEGQWNRRPAWLDLQLTRLIWRRAIAIGHQALARTVTR